MPSDDLASSPAPLRSGASLEEELAYYKAQYEQLEIELQEFQASSRELEAELERDIEQADKREHELNGKVENARYEVEEWKAKYKQSKAESTSAQSTLQKEITTLRDANRTLTLKLRDIEVANDDFERQARHTAGSLEDLEGRYNVAIERGVMLEEEIRNGEAEREQLRIEYQRIKDELSDLRVEHEITQEKLANTEAEIHRLRSRRVTPLGQADSAALRPPSPQLSESSASATTPSSPTVSTPPPIRDRKGDDDTSTVQSTPPSPPLSDGIAAATKPQPPKTIADLRKRAQPQTPVMLKKRSTTFSTSTTTSRPSYMAGTSSRPAATPGSKHTRGPSVPATTPSTSRMQPPPSTSKLKPPRPSFGYQQDPLPRSGSLYQIRGLTAKIQSLEKRVQTVRSKLPGPTTTPPRASPRSSTIGVVPPTVTVRSNRKRQSQATNTSAGERESMAAPASRLSFGVSKGPSNSRPSSRASVSSSSGHPQLYARPSSRTSMSGARTPISSSFAIPERPEAIPSSSAVSTSNPTLRRPRSSISGSYAHAQGHAPHHSSRQSISGRSSALGLRSDGEDAESTPVMGRMSIGPSHSHKYQPASYTTPSSGRSSAFDERPRDDTNDDSLTPTALRRSVIGGSAASGIPVPVSGGRRQSGGLASAIPTLGRRQSSGQMMGDYAAATMRPPSSQARLSEVEET